MQVIHLTPLKKSRIAGEPVNVLIFTYQLFETIPQYTYTIYLLMWCTTVQDFLMIQILMVKSVGQEMQGYYPKTKQTLCTKHCRFDSR